MRWLRNLAFATCTLTAAAAAARSQKTLAYPRDQVWPAAVRFVRVDEKLKIVEKDETAGYVLFELADEGKTFRGALEVIAVVVDGRPQVRFVIAIEDRPSYLEIAMLTRLEHKLRAELGSPAPAPTPAPPPAPTKPAPPADKPRDEKRDPDAPPTSPTP